MKILTINAHSIVEEDYENKLRYFVDKIAECPPDIIAMQEVNQSIDCEEVLSPQGFVSCGGVEVKSDNHTLRVVKMLAERGIEYHWTWEGIKRGYDKYDEGLAILSRYPIIATDSIYISRTHDYSNWKTRKLLGIDTPYGRFYTVHMGWWDDKEEPFFEQWKRVREHISGKAWLMGDFNSPDSVRGEGYDAVIKSGWKDVYSLARECDSGITVRKKIDGWDSDVEMRIDYIFCNYDAQVKSVGVIFDGNNGNSVSDHAGVVAEIE